MKNLLSNALTFRGYFLLGLTASVVRKKTFDADPNFTQSLELSAYTATPLLMVGLTALYPVLWFVAVAGIVALSYSVYLLYSGIPIMMNIPEDKGFIYASSVVTCGLVLLVGLMAFSAILLGMGFGSVYLS